MSLMSGKSADFSGLSRALNNPGYIARLMLASRSKDRAKFRILLVEDNHYDAELTKAVVQVYVKCQVVAVATKEAFEAELDQSAPDLILSDSGLEGFDGREALAFAAQRHPKVPFVFFTGNASETVRTDALARGAADCISKDDVLGLISVVRRFCHGTEAC